MRAAAYCFVCSISDPGTTKASPTVVPDLRGYDERHLSWPLVVVLVAAGSVLGIPAIFLSETVAGILAAWISAPVIEELFKPFGLYLLIARWPGTVTRQPSIAALAGLAGLAFGLMESALYVFVYQPSGAGESYALFRFTIPVAMHMFASTLFGFGVNRRAFQSLAHGDLPVRHSWIFILAAMVLHASYNVAVTILEFI